ncbi:MAG: cytochrome P450, partial [Candidatus Rokuibacteriota bacterium]
LMRPQIQVVVDRLLDRVERSRRMDVIADLAYPLPVTVICEMLRQPGAADGPHHERGGGDGRQDHPEGCLRGHRHRGRQPGSAHFPDPDRLDIGRHDNRHIAFGFGIHFCLGAPLARVEGQLALGALIRRIPKLRLASPDLEWRESSTLRGLKALPVEF